MFAWGCFSLPPPWRAEADALKTKGDAEGALAVLQRAAAAAAPSAAIEDEIGFLLAVLNRRNDAMARFHKALALDPKFSPAAYHLGVALWLDGQSEAALESLAAAARLAPREFDYRYRYGIALRSSLAQRPGRLPEGRGSESDRVHRRIQSVIFGFTPLRVSTLGKP